MEQTRQSGFWDGGSKVMFFMGLFLGIAVVSTLGLGLALGGVLAGNGSVLGERITAVDNPGNGTGTGAGTNTPPPTPTQYAQVKAVAANDHIRGNKNAKVTMIEYSDFECPFCKRFTPTIDQALKDFPNDVRLVYRHFPLKSIHPSAQKAAEASECAAKLGGDTAFWKMHDKLIAATTLSVDVMKGFAKDSGVDQAKFNACLDSGETAGRVDTDLNEGSSFGVEGTPATFINGQLASGAIPYDGAGGLKELLQKAGAAK